MRVLLLLAALLVTLSPLPARAQAPPSVTFTVKRAGVPFRCEAHPTASGGVEYEVQDAEGARRLDASAFGTWLLERPRAHWWQRVFAISTTAGIAWVALGALGQLVFGGRMIVQWIASERAGRSVVPRVFWWMSLGGSVALGAYFIWRRDVIALSGQLLGCGIYLRNLHLLRR